MMQLVFAMRQDAHEPQGYRSQLLIFRNKSKYFEVKMTFSLYVNVFFENITPDRTAASPLYLCHHIIAIAAKGCIIMVTA